MINSLSILLYIIFNLLERSGDANAIGSLERDQRCECDRDESNFGDVIGRASDRARERDDREFFFKWVNFFEAVGFC